MNEAERKRTAAALREPSMFERVKGFAKSITDPRATMNAARAGYNQRQQGLINSAVQQEVEGGTSATPYDRNR